MGYMFVCVSCALPMVNIPEWLGFTTNYAFGLTNSMSFVLAGLNIPSGGKCDNKAAKWCMELG